MRPNTKNSYSNKNSNRAEARSRARGKKKSTSKQQYRDDKVAGVEREFFDELDTREEFSPHDFVVKVVPPREVQVGFVKKGQFSTPLSDGTVVVADRVFRKEKKESWPSYKERVGAHIEESGSKEARRRVAARDVRGSYLDELKDILERLRLRLYPNLYFGSKQGGQRKRMMKAAMRVLPSDAAQICVDGVGGPLVLFFNHYVQLTWDLSDLNQNWGRMFAAERARAAAIYDSARVYEPVLVDPVKADSFTPQSYPGVSAWSDFSEIVGSGATSELVEFCKAHWHLVPRVVSECYSLSLVPSADRVKYICSRVVAEMCRVGFDMATAQDFVLHVLSHPAVIALLGALNFGSVFQTWSGARVPVSFSGIPQGFMEDVMRALPMELAPGTVLHGVLVLSGAFFAYTQMADKSLSASGVATALFRYVSKVPVPTSTSEVVLLAFKQLPIVCAAVTAAIAARSLSALVGRGDSLYTRFVDIQTAHALHIRGVYPNDYYVTSDSFVRDMELVYCEMRELVNAGDANVARVWPKMSAIRSEVLHDQIGKWRVAPFSITIWGESGIGKSDILHKLIGFLSKEKFGRPTPPDRIFQHNSADKYASGARLDHEVCIMDDVGNPKASQGTTIANPTAPIIEMVNNVCTPLNMADLGSKGNLYWNFLLLFITSNVPDLNATLHSNEPISVLRRINLFILPVVREQYRMAGSHMLDPSKVPANVLVPDLWSFKLRFARKNPNNSAEPFYWVDVPFPEEATLLDLVDLLVGRMKVHFEQQDRLRVGQIHRPYLDVPMEALRSQLVSASAIEVQGFAPLSIPVCDAVVGWRDAIRARQLELLSYVPTFSAFAQGLASWLFSRATGTLWARYGLHLMALFLALLALVWNFYFHMACLALLVMAILCRRRAQATPLLLRHKLAFASLAAFAVWALLRRKPLLATPQSAVSFEMRTGAVEDAFIPTDKIAHPSRTRTFSQLRDATRRKGVYTVFSCGSAVGAGVLLPVRTGIYATNYHIVAPLLHDGCRTINLVMFRHTATKGQAFCITPAHIFVPDKRSDLAFMSIMGPKEADFVQDFIPQEWLDMLSVPGSRVPIDEAALLLTRVPDAVLNGGQDPSGSLTTQTMLMSGPPRMILVDFPFKGGPLTCVTLALKPWGVTRRGDCGSHLVLSARVGSGRVSVIAGVLSGLANVAGESMNVFTPITQEACSAAIEHFTHAVFQSVAPRLFGQPRDMDLDAFDVHKELPQDEGEGSYVHSLGVLKKNSGPSAGCNVASLNTFRSNLVRGMFYESAELDVILGPLRHRFPVATTHIDHYANPVRAMNLKKDLFCEEILALAADDFTCGLQLMLRDIRVRPASLFEACNKDEFLPSFKLDTASGFGRQGSKEKYMVRACTRACTNPECGKYHPGASDFVVPGRINFYPDETLLAEVMDLEEKLATGGVNLAIFRAALKDEAIGLEKTKIRAFYVGTIAVNLLVRRYIMPFLVRLQGKRDYECKLGINVFSREWSDLFSDMDSYHPENRLGGDYSGFDLSVHSRLLESFYETINTLARDEGWGERELCILDALGKNLSHPVYIFLGQAFAVDGSNPSGVASTTHANSGVNAILHRYAFYSNNKHLTTVLAGSSVTNFAASVKLCTYGDDVIGAVRQSAGVYSITNIDVQKTAALFGMRYGPADKSAGDLPPYYHKEELAFLKCDDVFVPQLGYRVGAVSLTSIRKALAFEHTSTFEARCSTLQSALRLYFPHAAKYGSEVGPVEFGRLRALCVSKLSILAGEGMDEYADRMLPTYVDILSSDANPDTILDTGCVIDMW